MLTEPQVIDAVCRELRSRGYRIEQSLGVTEKGEDIIASKEGPSPRVLVIEAKGETSSKLGSGRHGTAFSAAQVTSHVARAVLKSLGVISREGRDAQLRAGVAFPATTVHRRELSRISPALHRLGVAVFWVGANGKVEIESAWDV